MCYEGVYPWLHGDFSQMEGLLRRNASSWVWSAGTDVPIATLAAKFARKYPGPSWAG